MTANQDIPASGTSIALKGSQKEEPTWNLLDESSVTVTVEAIEDSPSTKSTWDDRNPLSLQLLIVTGSCF